MSRRLEPRGWGPSCATSPPGRNREALLRWLVSVGGDGVTRVELAGELTESCDLEALRIAGRQVVFDFVQVRRINSSGLHTLLEFLGDLDGQSITMVAQRCSPALVTQLNLVPRLAHYLTVQSLIVPLECPVCEAEEEVLVSVTTTGTPPVVPVWPCDECGTTMLLAELEERYFAFLTER